MGMFTEIVVSTRLRAMPPVVLHGLSVLCGKEELHTRYSHQLATLHPLFTTTRWRAMLNSSSYYFVPRSTCLLEFEDISKTWCLIARSDLKNYDNEIEEFFSFILPYLDEREKTMIGYSRYEEDQYPTLYFGDGSILNVQDKME